MQYNKIIFSLILCTIWYEIDAHITFLNPHDSLIRPYYTENDDTLFCFIGEKGIKKVYGTNDNGHHTNILQTLECEQNALSMLNGFDPISPIGQLRTRVNATDDGVRGHLSFFGQLNVKTALALGGQYRFGNEWSIHTYLPFYSVALNDVSILDKTLQENIQDSRVKDLLTDNLAQNVLQLGCLDIGNWKRRGIGDWRTDVLWSKNFVQEKMILKNVNVEWRLGLSLPTAKRTDEDKLFAYSFGFDGSCAIPFAVAMELQLGSYIRTGIDIELTHIFGNTRYRRIKTREEQTEFLLLEKTRVYKDYGLNQQFNLHVGYYDVQDIFSFSIGYQFFKHGDDEISLKTNSFSNEIANRARNLDEYIVHTAVINAHYDLSYYCENTTNVRPRASLFTRIAFNGKNAALYNTLGGSISIEF